MKNPRHKISADTRIFLQCRRPAGTETHARSVTEVEAGECAQSSGVGVPLVQPATRRESHRVRKQSLVASDAVQVRLTVRLHDTLSLNSTGPTRTPTPTRTPPDLSDTRRDFPRTRLQNYTIGASLMSVCPCPCRRRGMPALHHDTPLIRPHSTTPTSSR